MSKIYISVHGGVVNGVYSANKKDKVEVWDWDDIDEECSSAEYEKKCEEFDNLTKEMHSLC